MTKKTVFDLSRMKENGDKITWITAYDFPTASLAEQAGIDMILVGDSVGMVVYGYSGTLPVTMDQMICHAEAVRRGAPETFVVGDMPFLSYQRSVDDAILNAGRFYKEAGVDAIKLEGGKRVNTTGTGYRRFWYGGNRPHRPNTTEFGTTRRLQGTGEYCRGRDGATRGRQSY